MYTTTLKHLRKAGACFEGYNRLVRHLQNMPFTEADEERESYIVFKYDEAIPVATIVKSNGITDACWVLDNAVEAENLRSAMILYAVACAKDVQHLMKDQRSYAALDVAERFAKGEATYEELTEAAARAARAAAEATWAARAAGENSETLEEKQLQHLIQICNAGMYVHYMKEQ